MDDNHADVAVIGLGAMGAATLYQLARRGVRAIGVDRHVPPHGYGSSHGETRLTRCAIGEGAQYVPLVLRSHEIWRELEAATGEALLAQIGCLIIAPPHLAALHHGKPEFLRQTIEIAQRFAIPHEILDSAEIGRRFPAMVPEAECRGYFEPVGGYLWPERCVEVQLRLARDSGARVLAPATVLAVEQHGGAVTVRTSAGTITADRAVVAAGAWAGGLLGAPFDALLTPYRQVFHYYDVAEPALYEEARFPGFIWIHGQQQYDYLYGFPLVQGARQIKIGTERYDRRIDPETVERGVAAEEQAEMTLRHGGGRLRGLAERPARSEICLYTVTPDGDFVIDRHPRSERLTVISACSGHGFKHSAAIGEAVAQTLCEGRSAIDLSGFSLARFGVLEAA